MVNQIAVFLENQKGRISECCNVLKNANISLRSMTVADTKDFGILRMTTTDNAKAIDAFKAAGFLVSSTNLIGLELPDKVGALADVLTRFDAEGINIEYLYSSVTKDNCAGILFKTASPDKANALLKEMGIKVL